MTRVLVVTDHLPFSLSRFLIDGFRELGVEVKTAGASTDNFMPWADGGAWMDDKYMWYPDFRFERNETPDVGRFVDALGDFDMILSFCHNGTFKGRYKNPIVCWGIDNHTYKYFDREWDVFFGGQSWGWRSTDSNFRWLPCAYSPKWHYDKGLARPIDVAIVGSFKAFTGYRVRTDGISVMVNENISVAAAHGKIYEEYNDIYNSAKVAFCCSAVGDLCCRVFENAAQGCVLLTDRVRDLETIGFVDGEDYYSYNGVAELVMQAKKLLADGDLRAALIGSMRAKLPQHTYVERARTILREVGL